MGAGKTTIAKLLSDKLKLPFFEVRLIWTFIRNKPKSVSEMDICYAVSITAVHTCTVANSEIINVS